MKVRQNSTSINICRKAIYLALALSIGSIDATEYRIKPALSTRIEVTLRCPKNWVHEDISSGESNEIVFVLPGSKIGPNRELLSVTVFAVGTYYSKTQRDRAGEYLAYLEGRKTGGSALAGKPVTAFATRLYDTREVYFFPSLRFRNHMFVSIQQKDALLQIDLSGSHSGELRRRVSDLKELANSVTFTFTSRSQL